MSNKAIESITEIQPRLNVLLDDAKVFMAEEPGTFADRSWHWYHNLKPQFLRLVGFDSTTAMLANSSSYNAVYQEFIDILKI